MNNKGQSSFEILFVTIIVILLAGILYYFTLGNTKEISNIGVIKTEVESFFVENSQQITISNIDLMESGNLIQAKIKLSKTYEFSETQIELLKSKIKEKIKKDVEFIFY
ncbi:MAG: hypothetical protein PHH82_00530 [Candidatus ainarchaeum sp.]|nr:hypothetical protein [Candidatus ainarchaeum sp.]